MDAHGLPASHTTDPNQRHAQQLATFLSLYRPLVDGLVKEFFVDGYWTNLPASWCAPLDALSFQDLAELLVRPTCSSPPPGVVWPLSLLAFMATVHALRLPGQFKERGGTEALPEEATEDLAASMAGLNMAGLNASDGDLRGPTGASWANNQRTSADGRCAEEQYMGIDLRLAVKPKKMHEIIHLVSSSLTPTPDPHLTVSIQLALTLTLTLTPGLARRPGGAHGRLRQRGGRGQRPGLPLACARLPVQLAGGRARDGQGQRACRLACLRVAACPRTGAHRLGASGCSQGA